MKASRQEAASQAEANLASKKVVATGSHSAVAAAIKVFELAQTTRKSAETSQKAAEKKIRLHLEKKKQLVDFHVGVLVPLKDGTPEGASVETKRIRKDILELEKEFKLEHVLVETAAAALQAKKDQRGSFQEVALTQLDQQIVQLIGDFDAKVTQEETAKSDSATAISNAKDHEAKCQSELEARENEHMVAKHEVAVAKKELAAADSAVARWIPDMRQLMDSLDKTKAELREFQNGPLAAFCELEALELPVVDPGSLDPQVDVSA